MTNLEEVRRRLINNGNTPPPQPPPPWTFRNDDPPPKGIPWEEVERWIARKRSMRADVSCPCCHERDTEKHRRFNTGMIRIVDALFDWLGEHGEGFVKLGDLLANRGEKDPREAARMAAGWGVVEEEKILRPDGGRAGYYRLTRRGIWWRLGYISIGSHAWDYRNNYIPDHTDQIYYHDVRSNPEKFRFDLEELRRRYPRPDSGQ